MNKLLQTLHGGKVLLLDGAMGTTLQQRGLRPGVCPESWNVSHPEKVRQVVAEYVAAGADMVETNSFGGSRYKLKHYGLADQTTEFNRRAAEISREAAGESVLVAGSVGPTGILMAPLGTESEIAVYEAFKEQVLALAAGGADAICIETMMALEEARAALLAAKDNTPLPVIVTFTFEKNTKGQYRTLMGVSPERVAKEFTDAGADVVGSNCGAGIEPMIEICRQMRQATEKPILIKPNAGLPTLVDGQTVFKETPQQMADHIPALIEAGADIVGGCCGTNADHIKAFRQVLDRYLSNPDKRE